MSKPHSISTPPLLSFPPPQMPQHHPPWLVARRHQTPPSRRPQERRLQRHPEAHRAASHPLPAGHLHHAGRLPVALDAARVRPLVRPLVAGVRRHLVADCVHARRPGADASAAAAVGERLDAVRVQHCVVHVVLSVLDRDAAHNWVRCANDDRRVPGGDLYDVLPVDLRRDGAGVHGRDCVRQDDATEAAHADVAVLAVRLRVPAGRAAGADVPRRRHAQESHHRGERAGAADQNAPDEGGRTVGPAPDGAGDRGRWRCGVGFVLHLADGGGASDYAGVAAVVDVGDGFAAGEVRDCGDTGGNGGVDGADDAGAVELFEYGDTVGTSFRSGGGVQ